MSEIATPGQLRMSYWRWAMFTVPALVLIGSLMGLLSNSGYDNRWFMALDRPAIVPPGWVFGVVWTTLYVLLGLSLAMILHARGARGRGFALALFFIFILMVTIATTFAFAPIRKAAAWLLVPYMIWLSFATILNFQIDQRNPDAETLVPAAATSQIG